jgi:type IV pilus assembly protein PilP
MKLGDTRAGLRLLALAGLAAAAAGCSSDQGDLQRYIDRIKARPGGAIEPLPEIRPAPSYEYFADDRRSPFLPVVPEQQLANNPNSVDMPDFDRPREYLESQPLDALTMVGRLRNTAGDWGLIQDPEGLVHRVTVGNHMGLNFGRITAISDSEIQLVEIVRDGLGGFMERPATISLND